MNKISKELLTKYLSGDATPEEQAAIEKELAHEDSGKILEQYIDEIEQETGEAEVSQQLIEEELQRFHGIVQPKRAKVYPIFRKAAVACAIVLLITSASFWLFRNERTQPEWVTINNNKQALWHQQLEDGTMVWLNTYSSIRYDKNSFNADKREVEVSGEVYFDVAHNAAKPFIVHTGELTTTVKGTAFNVESFNGEHDIRITLLRGKVEVSAAGQGYSMVPGEKLSYNIHAKKMAVKTVATELTIQWMNGTLVFDDLSLEDALRRMENRFNIRIHCEDSTILSGKRIRGQYQNKTPEEVLQKVLFIHRLKAIKQGGVYVIRKD